MHALVQDVMLWFTNVMSTCIMNVAAAPGVATALFAFPAESVGGRAANGAGPDGESRIRDMVALDCEMCYCDDALEVTRITLLDKAGEVGFRRVYDTT
jgi:hypothetical protein